MDCYKPFFMALLRQLVAVPSQSQNEEACAEFLTSFLREELGLPAHLERIEGKSCSVTAVLRGRETNDGTAGGAVAPRSILLGGHLDTVAAAEGWEINPFELTVRGDRGYGLGAADMKGGLAAQITVMKRLVDEGARFDGEIHFAALCDEERHSIGAAAYVGHIKAVDGPPPDFAVFAEPHYDNIVVGATGKVLLKLTVKGTVGHAANPETGVNAVDCMASFLTAVSQKYDTLYRSGRTASHCVLQVESRYEGYSLNIPEECMALMNKQLYVSEQAEDFIADLQEIYRREVGRGILSVTREIPYYPSYNLDREDPELQSLLTILRETYGHAPELRLNQSVSDGNILYSELGIPTVLFGPAGHDYHKPNEYIILSSAERYMEMLYGYLGEYFRPVR